MEFCNASLAQSSPAPEKESWLFPELSDTKKQQVKTINVVGHSPSSRNSTVPILLRPNSPAFPLRVLTLAGTVFDAMVTLHAITPGILQAA